MMSIRGARKAIGMLKLTRCETVEIASIMPVIESFECRIDALERALECVRDYGEDNFSKEVAINGLKPFPR